MFLQKPFTAPLGMADDSELLRRDVLERELFDNDHPIGLLGSTVGWSHPPRTSMDHPARSFFLFDQ